VDFTSVNQRSTTVPSSNTTPSATLPMPLTPLASSVRSKWNNFNSDLDGMAEAAVRLGVLAFGCLLGSVGRNESDFPAGHFDLQPIAVNADHIDREFPF
jgi:hypothetical protein